jgi:myosin heavy subunit
VVDLIEGKKPPGLFSLLDDICYTIHAQSGPETDPKFLQVTTLRLSFRVAVSLFNLLCFP